MDPLYHQKKITMDIGKKKKQDTGSTTQLNQKHKYQKDYLDYKHASEQN